MISFKLASGGIINIQTTAYLEDGVLEFKDVKQDVKTGLLSYEARTGGIPAIGVVEGDFVAIPEDIEFALVGLKEKYEVEGAKSAEESGWSKIDTDVIH